MFNDHKILAFIGARSGSKGLPGKNIIPFQGKPLIQWTIDAAFKSKFIDRVIVSTDCEDIQSIALKCGADAPFLRPKNLSSDDAKLQDAILHGIDWISEHESRMYNTVLSLQPTSPLRTARHIDDAIAFYFSHDNTDKKTLVSVKKLPKKLGWIMEMNEEGYINFCFSVTKQNLSRQDLKTFYLPNGAIYIAPIPLLREIKTFYTDQTLKFVMDEKVSVDIDTYDDLKEALSIISTM